MCLRALPFVFFFLMIRRPPRSTLFPFPPLFRSVRLEDHRDIPAARRGPGDVALADRDRAAADGLEARGHAQERRSEEHTSELQSRQYLVCCLLLEKKKSENVERVRGVRGGGHLQ